MHVSQHVLGVSRTISLVAGIVVACVVPAVAQTNGGSTQMSPAERAFVVSMMQIARGQIALAKLAEQRTNNPDAAVSTREVAAEWYALRAHLASLAAEAGAPYPVALSATQQTKLAQLQEAPPSNVMAVWVKLARQGNRTALDQMRAEGSATNSQISEFIAYARPELTGYDQTGYDHVMTAKNSGGTLRTGSYSWSR
jgi:predicted outer membrane protein